jgi:hypothetical protein
MRRRELVSLLLVLAGGAATNAMAGTNTFETVAAAQAHAAKAGKLLLLDFSAEG